MKALILAAALALAPLPAFAHKLKVFVSEEGAEVVGSAYFAGGGIAGNLTGQIFDAEGRVVATVHTDAQGAFRYTPPDAGRYRIRFESGDGHMAESAFGNADAVSAAALPAASAPLAAADTAALETALARQLRPLREQIDALDARARLSDIVGGIGYIFGLFGCAAWVTARRRRTPS